MSADAIFLALNALFFVPWFILFISKEPRFESWHDRPSLLSLMAILYSILIIYSIYLNGGLTNMFEFETLKASFQQDTVMLLGWLHYLIFDLFVGIHVQHRVCSWAAPLRISVLVLCLMLGPIGYLAYICCCYFKK